MSHNISTISYILSLLFNLFYLESSSSWMSISKIGIEICCDNQSFALFCLFVFLIGSSSTTKKKTILYIVLAFFSILSYLYSTKYWPLISSVLNSRITPDTHLREPTYLYLTRSHPSVSLPKAKQPPHPLLCPRSFSAGRSILANNHGVHFSLLQFQQNNLWHKYYLNTDSCKLIALLCSSCHPAFTSQ